MLQFDHWRTAISLCGYSVFLLDVLYLDESVLLPHGLSFGNSNFAWSMRHDDQC